MALSLACGALIPELASVDILVVGGGTAGAVAGIAAGRTGYRTLVVEQLGCLGGTQTAALVTPMMPNQVDQVPLNGGIDGEINQRLNDLQESGVWKDGNRGWFNPESLKWLLEEMLLASGAELLYYSFFEDVIVSDQQVLGIVVTNKAGRGKILAQRTIDATGDGDVAYRAGVAFASGDPETGVNQPFSVRFHLGNVDLARFAEFLGSLGRHDVLAQAEGSQVPLIHTAMVWERGWTLEPLFRQGVADGVLLPEDGEYFQVFTMAGRPGELAFNCPRISGQVDGTNPWHLTQAQILGRRAMRRYLAFCRRYLPGCENAYLVMGAPLVGVRESRRLVGEYVLTEADVLGARKFPDGIGRNNYPIDIHRPTKDQRPGLTRLPAGEYHEIPYRCLVPVGVEQLLVAGRCLSATFAAQGSVRVQSNCRAMGEAAAVAMGMSLTAQITPRRVDGVQLRQKLIAQGAKL
ncbi:fumarate reductase/succinate dehydrogenase flavoprotein domain-containing protein [Gloeomargarita lithophora Alchichica-D10]|uniref:Fumarate reductase/succinate dehydrogenase flavoprotein domain-containing protein n=1 Tax=Gloeomargarita lithophora Alchichica-D10 TaxID=1188229 RepID=A0A1J0AEZ6_9CYAN|nr:FAD-dependent oxidoreductase [Gloeomargarita lithophora]APB34518.1 fumarate reductase/succinate dehydrogenase flavoprotein domain-containing protein [Gloeomargarita lithophora Alchichica-D10]